MNVAATAPQYEFPKTSQTSGTGTNTVEEAQDSKQMFLKLLVAQIQNQNPLSPADPAEFLGQLTQYSMLEQLILIREGVEAAPAVDAAAGDEPTAPVT